MRGSGDCSKCSVLALPSFYFPRCGLEPMTHARRQCQAPGSLAVLSLCVPCVKSLLSSLSNPPAPPTTASHPPSAPRAPLPRAGEPIKRRGEIMNYITAKILCNRPPRGYGDISRGKKRKKGRERGKE